MHHEDYQTLESELKQFTGTDDLFRHPLNRKMVWTDGVQHFAEKAKAFWLLDLVALGVNGNPGPCPLVVPNHDHFGIVIVRTPKGICHVDVVDDIPGTLLWHERIGYSSLPDSIEAKFYLVESDDTAVLMLPGEY